MWQGLGYYSRARNLLKAVREVVSVYGGELPRDRTQLEGLPGVGPYTAGALASIAFGEPEPAVDGNVRRVLARLMDDPVPKPGTLEGWARGLVDPDRPGDFNQALMELGAMVCTPRSPSCSSCPVSTHCQALAQGTVEKRPAPKTRRAIPHLVEAVAVVVRTPIGGRPEPDVLLLRRPATGLLARMWGCPGREVTGGAEPARVAWELARELLAGEIVGGADDRGLAPGESVCEERAEAPGTPTELPSVEHVFSHRKVTYRPYHFLVEEADAPLGDAPLGDNPNLRWVSLGELGRLPLPAAQLRILDLVRGADVDGPP